jgi:PhnB protein
MPSKARAVPSGHRTVTPHLVVDDAIEAIDFYTRAFDAREMMRVEHDGKIRHAQIAIGNSRIMISDECPEAGLLGPRSIGGSPVRIFLYVANADTFVGRAVAVGAKLRQQVDEKLYGDRSGSLEDPFGHTWQVATRREDVSTAEMQRRANAPADPADSG